MSVTFRGFSKSARLYAEYSAVVDEMWELFKADIASFLDAVRDRVNSQLRTGKLLEEISTTYRSWWVEGEHNRNNDDIPYIWFHAQDARIVVPGAVKITVVAEGNLKPKRPQFASLLKELKLPDNCERVDSRSGGLFTVTVSYGEEDPVTALAEPVALLLEALHEAERKLTAGVPS